MNSQINQLSPTQLHDLTTRFSAEFLQLWGSTNLWRHCCAYEATAVWEIPYIEMDQDALVASIKPDQVVEVLPRHTGERYYPQPFEITCTNRWCPKDDSDENVGLEAREVASAVFSMLSRQVLFALSQAAEGSGGIGTTPYLREEVLRWIAGNPTADTLVISSALAQGLLDNEVFHHDEYAPVEKHALISTGLAGAVHLWNDESRKAWQIEPDRKLTVYTDAFRWDDFKVWDRGDHTALLYRKQDVKLWELPSTALPVNIPGDLKCAFSHLPPKGDEITVWKSFAFAVDGPVAMARFTL